MILAWQVIFSTNDGTIEDDIKGYGSQSDPAYLIVWVRLSFYYLLEINIKTYC